MNQNINEIRKNITITFEQPILSNLASIANSECFKDNQSLAIRAIVEDFITNNKSISIPGYGEFRASELIENGNNRLNFSEIKGICTSLFRKEFLDNLNNLPSALKISTYEFIVHFVRYLHKRYTNEGGILASVGTSKNISFYDTQGYHCLYMEVQKVKEINSDQFLSVSYRCQYNAGRYPHKSYILEEIEYVLKENNQEIQKNEKRDGIYINADGFKILAAYYRNQLEIS